jgi:ABC-type antimicrobial peptide transport system permease subunit
MCAVYTGAFIKFDLLDKDGRFRYADLKDFKCDIAIDKDRARHEIALIDTEKQEVRYGLESLFYILSNRLPFLQILFRQNWFVLIMKQLYYFISYNRKVIAPSSVQNEYSCNPDFHLKYRALYILVMMYVVGYFAYSFGQFLTYWIYWAFQVIFAIYYFGKDIPKSMSYLGHQITILLIFFSLLIPSIFLPNLLSINIVIAAVIAIKEVWRRWKIVLCMS